MAAAAAAARTAAMLPQVGELPAAAAVHPACMYRCRCPRPMYLASICPTAAAAAAVSVVSFVQQAECRAAVNELLILNRNTRIRTTQPATSRRTVTSHHICNSNSSCKRQQQCGRRRLCLRYTKPERQVIALAGRSGEQQRRNGQPDGHDDGERQFEDQL